jgi:hypothetical protein
MPEVGPVYPQERTPSRARPPLGCDLRPGDQGASQGEIGL